MPKTESKLEEKLHANAVLKALGIEQSNPGCFAGTWLRSDTSLQSLSPVDGSLLATTSVANSSQYETSITASQESFKRWRELPAPKRGEVVYEIGRELRAQRESLGALISWEMGKILPEGIGEVQEAIDIADFAVGLSRQLYGKTMHSERPQHRMYEQWHPLGPVAVITAFNFPVAVWAWNAMIALVCGNSVIWKPSEQTPLTAIAVTKICANVCERFGYPALLSMLIDADASIGKQLAADGRIPLISATGSSAMGKAVGTSVAARLGRSLLELGGNNAVIVCNDAPQDLALRAVLFGAVGTAGQRCTTTRRLILESGVYDSFLETLSTAYAQIKVGHPLYQETLCGPLINQTAVESFDSAVQLAQEQGGKLLSGGGHVAGLESGLYVQPTLIEADAEMPIVAQETFAPILYVLRAENLEDAIRIQNDVPQGLSSAIFTASMRKAECFLSATGSDCGIANVNIGTSGAEIGGAFGGEKETGGGREAGSDSWKAYMRRQTNTSNWGEDLPLAQGISFGED